MTNKNKEDIVWLEDKLDKINELHYKELFRLQLTLELLNKKAIMRLREMERE